MASISDQASLSHSFLFTFTFKAHIHSAICDLRTFISKMLPNVVIASLLSVAAAANINGTVSYSSKSACKSKSTSLADLIGTLAVTPTGNAAVSAE